MQRKWSRRSVPIAMVALLMMTLGPAAIAEEEGPPPVVITGTVTDTLTGAPLGGMGVMIFRVTPGVGAQPIGTTPTAADGTYRIETEEAPDAIGITPGADYEMEYRYPGLTGAGPFVYDLDVYPTAGEPAVRGRLINGSTGELLQLSKMDVFLHYTTFVDGDRPFMPFSVGYPGQVDRRPADPDLSFEYYRVAPGQELRVEGWVPGFGYGDGESRGVLSETVVYDGTTPVELTIELWPHFTDVEVPADPNETTELEAAIAWIGDREIASGFADGGYRPRAEVTRQALAAFLYRLAGSPEQAASDSFDDVSADHSFAREIAWMAETGLSTGYDDGTFRPTQPITRQAMAAMLYRYAEGVAPADHAGFDDIRDDHPFAEPIAWMEANRITTGFDDGTFRPNVTIRRGPTALFLYRLDQLHEDADG